MKYGMPRKCDDERLRMLVLVLLAVVVVSVSGVVFSHEWREGERVRAEGAGLAAEARAWLKKASGVGSGDWRQMTKSGAAGGQAVHAEDGEGKRLREVREAASGEERRLAAEAVASLGEFGGGEGGAVAGWTGLVEEVGATEGVVTGETSRFWVRKEACVAATRHLEAALAVGREALERHEKWAAARRRLADAKKAEKQYWGAVPALKQKAQEAVAEAKKARYGEDGGYGKHLARMEERLRAGDEALTGLCFEDAQAAFEAVTAEAEWLKSHAGTREGARREWDKADMQRRAAQDMGGDQLATLRFMEGEEEWRKAAEAYESGLYQEAIGGWQRAGQAWKEVEAEARRQLVEEDLSRARSESEAGEWMKAYEEVEKALALSPEAPEVQKMLAEIEAHLPAGTSRTLLLPGGAPMELVWCPPGAFRQGAGLNRSLVPMTNRDWYARSRSDKMRPSEEGTTDGFWMAKYEVTQKQWQSVMGRNPAEHKGDELPVETVSWTECADFCRRAGHGLRLPTEGEWEYACRAGTAGGARGKPEEMGWYINNSMNCSHPVGSKAANEWGLHDMLGNVWEWCGSRSDKPPERPVRRGGGYGNSQCAADSRSNVDGPTKRIPDVGFRPVIGTP